MGPRKPDQRLPDALGLPRYTNAVPSEETLQKAFRLLERQSGVDYFICKDAKGFLREQFDLWMWQCLLGKPGEESQTEWTETRLKQLQALRRIAYRMIDLIAAFEDKLVKIWNKSKFARTTSSHWTAFMSASLGSWSASRSTRASPSKCRSGESSA